VQKRRLRVAPQNNPKSDVKLQGSMVAIVTPMHANGDLDFARLKALIDWHVAEGTDGIVIVGTTGESPTVDFDEHQKLIAAAVEYADKRIPVIAGTGANSTKEAIFVAEGAKRAGADYSLSVVPYYNKPTQEGLYQHFKAITNACDLPLILYNVPGRTVADLANDTVLRLAELPNIVGIKDATASMARGAELLKFAPKNFGVYSGEDVSTLALMLLGAHGTISVTANVAPRLMHEMCMAALAGEREKAIAVNNRLLGLHNHLFLEANPIPVKWALEQMGRIDSGIRLPLTRFESKFHETLRTTMREAGVL
jgi:4-hydroxy-tetrahydrodipicolinate synthase